MRRSRAIDGAPVVRATPADSPLITIDGTSHPRGSACPACHTRTFPAAVLCPGCHTPSMVETALADRGVVYTHTRVHTASDGSYALAYIDLDDGVRLLGRLDRDVPIGAAVRVDHLDGDAIVFAPGAA